MYVMDDDVVVDVRDDEEKMSVLGLCSGWKGYVAT